MFLASDRQLTFVDGENKGDVAEDDACKLVSLCHVFGIGYTGLARLEGKATHEWIATTLAAAGVGNVDEATRVLADCAAMAVQAHPPHWRRLSFVVAGWEAFDGTGALTAHACLISNAHDRDGRLLSTPTAQFDRHILILRPDAEHALVVIGEPLQVSRRETLKRNLRRLRQREIGPAEAMRLMVDEIVNTHRHGQGTVGRRVLAFCIPRNSAETYIRTGSSRIVGMPPVHDFATFAYFDFGYSKQRQHAPTFVCGNQAAVIDEIELDPESSGVRRMSFRMLTHRDV